MQKDIWMAFYLNSNTQGPHVYTLKEEWNWGGQGVALCSPAWLWNKPAEPPASSPGGGRWSYTGSSTGSSWRPGWTPGALPQAGHWGPHTLFWPSLIRRLLTAAGSYCSQVVCHSAFGWASEALGIRTAKLTGGSRWVSESELPAKEKYGKYRHITKRMAHSISNDALSRPISFSLLKLKGTGQHPVICKENLMGGGLPKLLYSCLK